LKAAEVCAFTDFDFWKFHCLDFLVELTGGLDPDVVF
jgi:hypothetical protein